MTIRPGDQWGEPWLGAVELKSVADDQAMAAEAMTALGRGNSAIFAVGSGDLARSLGLTHELERAEPMSYPFDLGTVKLDSGLTVPFVTHCVVRNTGWLGEAAAIMNTGWYRRWYLGPRAHPNDGLLDITWGRLDLRQSIMAWRRARTGTHLPHPELKTRRVSHWEHQFQRPKTVWVDGVRVGRTAGLFVETIADAFTVVG